MVAAALSEINWPIKILIGTTMMLEIKPVTAAASCNVSYGFHAWRVEFPKKPILKLHKEHQQNKDIWIRVL
jgi:hypothetical protein